LVSGQAVWLWQLLMLRQLFRKPLPFILSGRLKLCRFGLMLLQLMLFMLHWLLLLRQILNQLLLMLCPILLLGQLLLVLDQLFCQTIWRSTWLALRC
jgi:hypothetical protein